VSTCFSITDVAWDNTLSSWCSQMNKATAQAVAPMMNPDWLTGGLWEPDGYDMDVNAIWSAIMKGAQANGKSA
jgi:hypothetical protein